jgi:hypothetical protein
MAMASMSMMLGSKVEVISDPFAEFVMTFVFWISDCIEEVSVIPGTAAVFGRASSRGLKQARIGNAGRGIDQALDFDRVLPSVTKVVEIFHCFGADVFEHLVEADLAASRNSPVQSASG